MVKNSGIRHVNIVVRDLDRAADFYCGVFGMEVASAYDIYSGGREVL